MQYRKQETLGEAILAGIAFVILMVELSILFLMLE